MSSRAPADTAAAPSARSHAERAIRSSEFEWLARAGFAARATIYLIIGILALGLATGPGGWGAHTRGAVETIARQPLGGVLLALVAVALAGYALWRLSRALLGHGSEGSRDSTLE